VFADILPVEDHRAALFDAVDDGVEGRGLAGPVGADEGDDGVASDMHVDAADRRDDAVVDLEVFDIKHG
jgi:hypothetical protein